MFILASGFKKILTFYSIFNYYFAYIFQNFASINNQQNNHLQLYNFIIFQLTKFSDKFEEFSKISTICLNYNFPLILCENLFIISPPSDGVWPHAVIPLSPSLLWLHSSRKKLPRGATLHLLFFSVCISLPYTQEHSGDMVELIHNPRILGTNMEN